MELKKFIEECGMDRVKALNILQRHGVISDNVIIIEDVAAADVPKATEFLLRYISPLQFGKPVA